MFDFFLMTDMKKEGRVNRKISFSNQSSYRDIKKKEYNLKKDYTYITYLERDDSENNIYESDNIILLVYGSAFSNKEYCSVTGGKTEKKNAGELFKMHTIYGEDFERYIKGSFIIVIVDTKKNELKLITDRLNVLPFYYFFKNGIFAVSSSIRMLFDTNLVSTELNPVSLTEQLMFDYVTGDKTHFKDINQTVSGTKYHISKEGVKPEVYWDVEELFHEKLLGKGESLELLSSQLHETVNLYAGDKEKILVSFTGGFDGRTNVAMLDRDPSEFLCYSYGMPGSKQIKVPRECCSKLGINYKPVYLKEDFEKDYSKWGDKAIEFSNGTAPIQRANYPYAYNELQKYSDTIISGLFGSEILRPVYNLGIQINDHSERLFFVPEYQNAVKQSIQELKQLEYLRPEVLDLSQDSIIDELGKNYFKKYSDYDQVTRFFFFFIKEGLRKFFMQEIQSERVYITNRFPYLDDDLISLIYQTPFAGMYNGFLGKSKFKRRKGQLLYAYIIKKYKPELGKFVLDRGYTPNDLVLPFPLNYLKIYSGVTRARKYVKKFGNDTFNSEKWTRGFFTDMIDRGEFFPEIGNGVVDAFKKNEHLKNMLTFSHILSLNHYVQGINK